MKALLLLLLSTLSLAASADSYHVSLTFGAIPAHYQFTASNNESAMTIIRRLVNQRPTWNDWEGTSLCLAEPAAPDGPNTLYGEDLAYVTRVESRSPGNYGVICTGDNLHFGNPRPCPQSRQYHADHEARVEYPDSHTTQQDSP